MVKFCEHIYQYGLAAIACCMLYCFVMSLRGFDHVIILVGVFVYVGIVGLVYKQSKRLSESRLNGLMIIMLSLYLLLALILGLGIKSERPTDIFHLHNAAISYLQNGAIANLNYFAHYPYQLSYTYVLIMVYKIGSLVGIADYRTSGTLFGAALLFFSALWMYRIAKKMIDRYLGIAALYAFITNPIFWIYSSYYYTDLMGMLFLLWILDTALCINAQNSIRVKNGLSFVLGFIIFTGYKFRATAAIGGIAVLGLNMVTEKRKKDKRIYFISFVAGFVTAVLGYKMIQNHFNIKLEKDMQFPIAHWVMMGLSDKNSGKWSGELWSYTNGFETYGEKFTGDMRGIQQSLSGMGLLGTFRLWLKKLVIMWSDGMTALTVNFRTSVHYGALYEYTIGNKNAVTRYCTQIMRSSLLLCTLPYLIQEIKDKFSRKSVLAISLSGYVLFYFLWEAHEKYALMFLPVLIVIAVYGVDIIIEKSCSWKSFTILTTENSYRADRENLAHLSVRMGIGIMSVTFLLFVLYWNTMTVKMEKRYNYVVNQSESSDSIAVGKDEIKQTFITELSFNAIYIRFLNEDIPREQQYMFSLYDDRDTCVYQERFTANDIEHDSYHAFYFDDVHAGGEREFYFQIAALECYEDTLELCRAGNRDADYFAKGRCTQDGTYKGDLTFRVYNIATTAYYPKTFYGMMAIMALLVEILLCRYVFNLRE